MTKDERAKGLAEAIKQDRMLFYGEGETRRKMLAAERIDRAWDNGKDYVACIGADGIARAFYIGPPPPGHALRFP